MLYQSISGRTTSLTLNKHCFRLYRPWFSILQAQVYYFLVLRKISKKLNFQNFLRVRNNKAPKDSSFYRTKASYPTTKHDDASAASAIRRGGHPDSPWGRHGAKRYDRGHHRSNRRRGRRDPPRRRSDGSRILFPRRPSRMARAGCGRHPRRQGGPLRPAVGGLARVGPSSIGGQRERQPAGGLPAPRPPRRHHRHSSRRRRRARRAVQRLGDAAL